MAIASTMKVLLTIRMLMVSVRFCFIQPTKVHNKMKNEEGSVKKFLDEPGGRVGRRFRWFLLYLSLFRQSFIFV